MKKNPKKLLVWSISSVALVFAVVVTLASQGCGTSTSTATYTLKGAPR